MPTPFSGGCLCGAIRYTCTAEPYVSYACHCTACQKRTASAFGTSEARKHITVVYAGTLDDPSWVPIMANIWADSALPWVPMAPDIERFGKAPDFSKYYTARET